MSVTIYLITLCLPLATILIVFGMRYFSMLQQAKARLAQEGGFRSVAEQAAARGSENAVALSSVQSVLNDVRARLIAIEKILKEVE